MALNSEFSESVGSNCIVKPTCSILQPNTFYSQITFYRPCLFCSLKPGCPPCPTSFTSVAAADLARQHLEWAQELESVDPWHEISGMDS